MKLNCIRAEKGRGFFAPRFTPKMFAFLKVVGPLYNRKVQQIGGVHTFNMEQLYQTFLDFQ